MNNKLRNLTFFTTFLVLIVSCDNSREYRKRFSIIERQDHQKCVSRGLDYGEWEEIRTEMYWRCRYNLVMDRKIHDATTAESIKHNAIIKRISEEILQNLNRAKYSGLTKIEDDIELANHNKCIKINRNLSAVNLNEANDYDCNQDEILSAIPSAPKMFNYFELSMSPKDQTEYLKVFNEIRNSRKEEIAAMIKQKYPNCVGLDFYGDDFKKCATAQKQSTQCLMATDELRREKELRDKIYCQQQAFAQFPDNYSLAKDKSASEIEKLKADLKKNQNNEISRENSTTLTYLESNKNLSNNFGRNIESDEDKETKAKERLYSRVELLKLRESFVYQCDKKMEEKLPEFSKARDEECAAIAKNWKMLEPA